MKSGDSAVSDSRYGLALKSADTVSSLGRAEQELVRRRSGLASTPSGLQELGVRQSRFIGGRMFYQDNGGWVDSESAKIDSNTKPIEIRFDSREYYDLIQKNPEVRAWLSLGTKVTFVLKGKLYQVIPADEDATP